MNLNLKRLVQKVEKYNAVLILFVFLLVSIFTGAKVGKIIALMLSKGNTLTTAPPTGNSEKKFKKKKRKTLADYSLLLSFNPFNPAETATSEVIQEENLEETSLNLSLLGTLVGEKSIAIIKNNRTGTTELYTEGETIKEESASVYRIEPTRVIIKRDGKLETLELFEKFETSPSFAKATLPGNQKASRERGRKTPEIEVKRVSENYFEIDREEIEKATSNLGLMMTQARIVPNIVMGEIKGYKIFAIKPGSIYDKIGLRNGDVIERINGIELKTPEDALQFFKELKNENQFIIDIDRKGEKLTFTYSIK